MFMRNYTFQNDYRKSGVSSSLPSLSFTSYP